MSATDRRSACPGVERMEAWAAGDRANDTVARHLDRCADCRSTLVEIEADNAFLSSMASAVAGEATSGSGELTGTDRVPGFRIVRELHRGGQGIVYEAYEESTRRPVAIKMLLHGALASPRQRLRFEREIEIAARLHHPNIVTLYQTSVVADGRIGYVMEYVDGVPIDRWSTRSESDAATPVRTHVELFVKICDAIEYAHERGVVHRDLKPANILIDGAGAPRVLDFGLARRLGPGACRTITATGEIVGTFAYAAPEQMSGDPNRLDTRTDVYALGVMLYELVTGRHPYRVAGSMPEIIAAITTATPTPPSSHCGSVDDELETIILKALAKDPQRRYAFAGALGDDLRRYLAGAPIDAKRDSTWYVLRKAARRHRVPVVIAAVFVVLLVGFAALMTVQADRLARERTSLADALRESRVELGRKVGLTQRSSIGEELLWREHLGTPASSAASPGPGRQPGRGDSYWALWEWYSRNPCLNTLAAHGDAVRLLCFDTRSELLATAGEDGVVRVWDARSGRALATLPAPEGGTLQMRFASSGQKLLLVGHGGVVERWRWADERRVMRRRLDGHWSRPVAADLSADGRRLAVAFDDERLAAWTLDEDRCTGTWQAPAGALRAVRVQPDGERVATCGVDGTLAVRDLVTGASVARHHVPDAGPVLEFGADGRSLVFIVRQAILRWDFEADAAPVRLGAHGARILAVCLTADDRHLASAGDDMTVRLWESSSGRATTLSGHRARVIVVATSADGGLVASGDANGDVRIWDVRRREAFPRFVDHAASVHTLSFNPARRCELASVAFGDRAITVRDLDSGTLRLVPHDGAGVRSLAYDPEGYVLAASGDDGRIRRWAVETAEPLPTLTGHAGAVNKISFGPSGRYLASGGDDRTVRVWDLAASRCRATLTGHADRIPSVDFHPADDARLVSGSMDGTVRTWDVRTGRDRVLGRHAGGVRVVRFSLDGRLIASGGNDWTIRLWDAASGRLLCELREHGHEIFGLEFTGNGLLASGSRLGVAKLWDLATQKCLLTLDGHENMILAMGIGSDGRLLATGSADTRIALWDLTYFDRHVAGNFDYHARLLDSADPGRPIPAAMSGWAERVIARPWPPPWLAVDQAPSARWPATSRD